MIFRRSAGRRVRHQAVPPPMPLRSAKPQLSPQTAPTPSRAARAHSWLQRAGLMILFLAILASVVNILSLSLNAKVEPLTVSGGNSMLRSTAVYQAAANQQLSRSIWNRNKITINTSGLSRQLLGQFPELHSVSVTVPLLAHRPVVYVEAAQPALVLVTGNGSFIVDTTGKALMGGTSLNQKLPSLNDQSGLRIQINRQALPAENVNFIQTVVAELAAKQFTVSDMTLPAAASELDVKLTGQPYFIKFNLESNKAREQAGTFLATITQLRRQNVTPAHYVDVRVGGRAYYQ